MASAVRKKDTRDRQRHRIRIENVRSQTVVVALKAEVRQRSQGWPVRCDKSEMAEGEMSSKVEMAR